jgi:4-oxalmesaconate hydratase
VDDRTGHHFDDTRRYVDAAALSEVDRDKVYAHNALRVYPRLEAVIGRPSRR